MRRWYLVLSRGVLAVVGLLLGFSAILGGGWVVGSIVAALGWLAGVYAVRHYRGVAPGAVSAVEDDRPPRYARKCNAVALLRYTDRNGEETEREVAITHYKGGDVPLMYGRCSLRRASRTFVVSRIRRCVDAETGEIITDVPRWLSGRRVRSDEAD